MRSAIDYLAKIRDPSALKGIAKTMVFLWFAALAAEISILALAPNEVMGWGEKPALRPDPMFGWRLIESRTTRLRWQGYDYMVTSNSLGFPGPEYSTAKPRATYRIMTIGSGFTSAEGVDTCDAWPRVLERFLNQRSTSISVEVLNFSITGFGPGQYAAVLNEYAPTYQPDLIIVALIPNDLKKVMTPFLKRTERIGFDRPKPNGLFSVLTCQHLMQYIRDHAQKIISENMRHSPGPRGYFWGQFWAFETGGQDFLDDSQVILEEHLATMKSIAKDLGSRLVLLLVPASIQICSWGDLDYLPTGFIPDNSTKYDYGQPQDRYSESASKTGLDHIDLRSVFDQDSDPCPYHPKNLHWTARGHSQVAEFLADRLLADVTSREN